MGNRIKDLREDNDLRQIDIAQAIGITQRKYSYIETGEQPLTEDLIIKLAKFYNISSDYLIGLTNVREPYPPTDIKSTNI